MEQTEKEVRKELDKLLENVKSVDDLSNLEFTIDDYIEKGYNVRDYIPKCNSLAHKFSDEN
jgi:hypothetical protein